jgi:hypothetical protein
LPQHNLVSTLNAMLYTRVLKRRAALFKFLVCA